MAYIELTPMAQAHGKRRELYEEVERVRGERRLSNLFKAYGAFPALGLAIFKRLQVLLNEGTLSARFKEGLMVSLAEINGCKYCVSFHGTAMRNAGANDDEIAAIREFDPGHSGFTEKERALFDYAMKLNGDAHSIVEADIEKLRALGVTDSELVETVETVNTGNSFNTLAGALNVGPDPFLTYRLDK